MKKAELVACSLQRRLELHSLEYNPLDKDGSNCSSILPLNDKLVVKQKKNDLTRPKGFEHEAGKEHDWRNSDSLRCYEDLGSCCLSVKSSVWPPCVVSKPASGESPPPRSTTRCWTSIPSELPAFLDPRSLVAHIAPRKHEPSRVALAEITKPLVYFDDLEEFMGSLTDYLKVITKLQRHGLAIRSVGLENLSISADAWIGIIICLDVVDVRLQEEMDDLPPIINTLPAKLPDWELEEYIFDPWESFRQLLLCFIWIMTTRSGPGNYERPLYESRTRDVARTRDVNLAYSAIYDWNSRGKHAESSCEANDARKRKNGVMNNFEKFQKEVVKYLHPYFKESEAMVRVLRAILYDVRLWAVREVMLDRKKVEPSPGMKKKEGEEDKKEGNEKEESGWMEMMQDALAVTQDAWNPEWTSKQQDELEELERRKIKTDENASWEAFEREKLPGNL